jgi:hypothetical protein
LAVDSSYGPEVYRRLHGEVKRKSSTWHMDETFVRIAGKWMYLFRTVDSQGQTVDFYLSETRDRQAAKLFLKKALANADNRAPHVFARDGLRSYPAALRELQAEASRAVSGPVIIATTGSNPITATSSCDCARWAADANDGLGGHAGNRSGNTRFVKDRGSELPAATCTGRSVRSLTRRRIISPVHAGARFLVFLKADATLPSEGVISYLQGLRR